MLQRRKRKDTYREVRDIFSNEKWLRTGGSVGWASGCHTIQYILNWPLPIGAFQGQWNTTKRRNRTTTTVKKPNWSEANQLAIYKCSWEVEPGTTRNKFNEWSERVLNPGSRDLKASALTTRPHCHTASLSLSCGSRGLEPRPNQHSGSENNWGESAAFVISSANGKTFKSS